MGIKKSIKKIKELTNENLRVHIAKREALALSLIATRGLSPLSQHHCIKDMLLLKIYLYQSNHCKIKKHIKYVETCNLQKA